MKPPTLFIIGCIPIRLLLVWLTYNLNIKYLPILGLLLFIIGFGFGFLYFGNLRLTAPEAGGKTWWHNYRLIHGMLYLTASIYAFQGKNTAWIPLLFDVLLGIMVSIVRYY
jgi:hypothetical protein